MVLIDDQEMLTEALAARLDTLADIRVVGRFATESPNLIEAVTATRPDVISVEPEQAGSPRRLLRRLVEVAPGVRVVALTGSADPLLAVEAARAGLVAWVPKERGADEFVATLRGVGRGYASYPPELLGAVLDELRADVGRAHRREGPLERLSGREREVLDCMVRGQRSAAIAAELGISLDTVRTHIRGIFRKLNVHSQLEAMSVARTAGPDHR